MRWFLVAALTLAACGEKAVPREPDEYTGCASDENWIAFDDQEPNAKTDDSMAPVFTAPAGGTIAAKTTFLWSQDPNDPGMATGDVPHDGPGCTDCCPEWNTGAITTMHLPPISGNTYDLQFTIDGRVQYRVVTTLQEWAAPDSVWASWVGKKVSLRIWRMNLLRNDVKTEPFTPTQPFVFTVGG